MQTTDAAAALPERYECLCGLTSHRVPSSVRCKSCNSFVAYLPMRGTAPAAPIDQRALRDTALSYARLKNWIRERVAGGCKVISLGSACRCPLCDADAVFDALATERITAASLRASLAVVERRQQGYREMLAAKLGYALIHEDTVVRPDAASHVKPSEFDRMIDALTEPDEASTNSVSGSSSAGRSGTP